MKRVFKIIGIVLGSLVALVGLLAAFFYQRTSSRMEQRFDIEPVLTSVGVDSATIARGEHVMEIQACQQCHGENLGGTVLMDMPLWRMTAANLTSGKGGVGRTYTVADWDRVIRSGVAPDGHAVMIMPGEMYQNLSDEDAAALIAYLQQIDPVDSELPATELRFLGGLMLGAGDFDPADIVHEPGSARKMTPAHEPTEELGEYLASTSCIGCHGDDLMGMESESPKCPAGPPLTDSSLRECSGERSSL